MSMATPNGGTGRYSNDPRVDRAINWIIPFGVLTAFAISGWFFKDLRGEIRELRRTIGTLAREVDRGADRQRQIDEIKADIREIRKELKERRQ